MSMASIAAEVAGMKTELDGALAQVNALTSAVAVLTSERNMLRDQLARASSERDFWMTRSTEQTTILENTAATLVGGINRQKQSLRARQEYELGVGAGDKSPTFLEHQRTGDGEPGDDGVAGRAGGGVLRTGRLPPHRGHVENEPRGNPGENNGQIDGDKTPLSDKGVPKVVKGSPGAGSEPAAGDALVRGLSDRLGL